MQVLSCIYACVCISNACMHLCIFEHLIIFKASMLAWFKHTCPINAYNNTKGVISTNYRNPSIGILKIINCTTFTLNWMLCIKTHFSIIKRQSRISLLYFFLRFYIFLAWYFKALHTHTMMYRMLSILWIIAILSTS